MSARDRRQNHILSLVRRHGFVSIEALAQQLEVTPQTIRRDINELCEDARLQRYHGGAGLPSSVENLSYSTRQVLCLEEKKRIAREVARHIPDHASLFINIGTTTEEVAKALLDHAGLRVITNNLNVANIMSGNPDFEVRDFNSNLVLRWEYNPGSTVFVVWSQTRRSFDQFGNDVDFSDDLDHLFSVHPENVVLIKVSKWFAP